MRIPLCPFSISARTPPGPPAVYLQTGRTSTPDLAIIPKRTPTPNTAAQPDRHARPAACAQLRKSRGAGVPRRAAAADADDGSSDDWTGSEEWRQRPAAVRCPPIVYKRLRCSTTEQQCSIIPSTPLCGKAAHLLGLPSLHGTESVSSIDPFLCRAVGHAVADSPAGPAPIALRRPGGAACCGAAARVVVHDGGIPQVHASRYNAVRCCFRPTDAPCHSWFELDCIRVHASCIRLPRLLWHCQATVLGHLSLVICSMFCLAACKVLRVVPLLEQLACIR